MFSKRHYEAIAGAMQEAFRRTKTTDTFGTLAAVAELSQLFKRDNARFNQSRFEAACVPGANVKARTRYEVPRHV